MINEIVILKEFKMNSIVLRNTKSVFPRSKLFSLSFFSPQLRYNVFLPSVSTGVAKSPNTHIVKEVALESPISELSNIHPSVIRILVLCIV